MYCNAFCYCVTLVQNISKAIDHQQLLPANAQKTTFKTTFWTFSSFRAEKTKNENMFREKSWNEVQMTCAQCSVWLYLRAQFSKK